ncbi:nitrate ABC transporter substrate-binding protein [Rhodococcus rhodnii]|nr:hypothetical protein [Rhodococcus rhodnii]TXG92456.1 nitrate ABC transporter substrate-binding protein [Rhodococcus rhodnii]
MTQSRTRLVGVVGALVATTLGLSSCAYAESTDAAPTDIESAPDEENLAGVCPETVGVQLQWQPQSDMGGLFELLGPGYTVDTEQKSITGPLVASGKDTGVDITLKAGGPAIGFQSVTSQMYVDDSVMLGVVHGDQLIAASTDQPVVGVTPLLTRSPAILMWDPQTHPDWDSIADIGESAATVVVSKDQIFPQWLVGKGILQPGQIDTSYDSAPARSVGDPSIAQQGFANSEPYRYEHAVPTWGEPVAFDLVANSGYDIYASNVAVRADRLESHSACLDKLVPIVQRAGAGFADDPHATNEKIVDIVAQDVSYNPYTMEQAEAGTDVLVDLGLLGHEDDGTFGTYDDARTQRNLDELRPILTDGGNRVAPELTGPDLFTNRFTDTTITECPRRPEP